MNDGYSITYSPKALDDLKIIASYISFTLNRRDMAREQIKRIQAKIDTLNYMPARHKHVCFSILKNENVHQMPVGNYVVFYAVSESSKSVTVARILYAGRDLSSIISEE